MSRHNMARWAALLGICLGLAGQPAFSQGRLLATGGISQIEGAAGGGIVPWAVIAGYGTAGQHGGDLAISHVSLPDYQLDTHSLAWGFGNRLELSVAQQTLQLGAVLVNAGAAAPGDVLRQDIAGAKLRLVGDLIYDTLPQLSLGVQHKRHRDFDLPEALGAEHPDSTDIYLSASRLFLGAAAGYNLLVNATVRSTEAHQGGLLGFADERSTVFEGSLAVFPNRHTAVGIEYRTQPDAHPGVEEEPWRDLFIAWFPGKQLALTLARVDLGSIAGLDRQQGFYLSAQASF